MAHPPALRRLGVPAGRLGEDHEREVAVRRRRTDPGAGRWGDERRGHPAVLLVVPREHRPAQRRSVRHARRAR